MPTKILKFQLKTYFKSKSFLCVVAVLLIFAAIIIGAVYSDEDTDGRFIYDVKPFKSMEELQKEIESSEKFILEMEEWLIASEGDLSISESVFETYRSQLSAERLRLNVMYTLRNVNGVADEYPKVTNMQSTKNNPAGVLGFMLTVGFTIICIYFAVRTALIYPTEAKGGQIKLTFLTPYGRIFYYLSRIASELVLGAIVLFGYAIITSLACMCFLGASGHLIIATSDLGLAVNFGVSLFLILGIYLFTLCALCVFSATLSIFIKKRILTFAVVSVLALLSKTLVPLIELFGSKTDTLNYIPPLCFFSDNAFTSGTGNSVWLCIVIGGISSLALLIVSLGFLKRRDI